MSSMKRFLKVAAKKGERTRKALSESGVLNRDYKIITEDKMLFIPLVDDTDESSLQKDLRKIKFETGVREFELIYEGPKTLAEALRETLNLDEIALLPRAYDFIGDIAVLEIPKELLGHEKRIGETLKSLHKNFTTVLAKQGAISGTTRVRQYTLLAGEDKTGTIHTEYGIKIAVDLAKAYFSPRLLEEHHRVAKQVQDGEIVLDMFTGVGPFALHIAKNTTARISAIDINPEAISLLRESMRLNKLVGTVVPIAIDAHEYIESGLQEPVDRVIMNHPSESYEYVSDACHVLKESGMIHYYDFIGGESPENDIQERILQLLEKAGKTECEVKLVRKVRDSAPYEYQMVADVLVN